MSLPSYESFLSGALAGTAGTVITFPLDLLKTRLQSASCYAATANGNIFVSLRHIRHVEGFHGLYKGLTASLLGIIPSRSIYFCSYSWGRSMFSGDGIPNVVASAAFGGFVTSTLMNPIWVIKTRFQLDKLVTPSTTIRGSFKKIYKMEGLFAFYRGLSATYLGIGETVIFFSFYEFLCRKYLTEDSHPLERTLFSAAAKSVACVVAYPHEVLRTRVREENAKYRTLSAALPGIFRNEGIWAFYRGMMTHFVRQVPNAAITLTVFETAMKYAGK